MPIETKCLPVYRLLRRVSFAFAMKNNTQNSSKSYYDRISFGYDDLYKDELSLAEDMLIKELLELHVQPGASVLDCGCGTGLARKLLYDVDCQYVGIDISRGMLDVAERNFPGEFFVLGDISDLSQFYDESFDCLVSLNGALSHVVDYKNAIRGFYRVLRRGGVLIVMLYSRYSISRILRMSFMRGSGIYKIRNSRGRMVLLRCSGVCLL